MEMAPSRVSNPLVPLISAEEHAASLARARAARGAAYTDYCYRGTVCGVERGSTALDF